MAIAFFFLVFLFLAAFLYFFSPPKHLFSWLPLSKFFFNPASKLAPIDREISRNNDTDLKDELKSVFATFDKNGDGFITKQELIDSLNNIRIFMTEKEVEEMLVKFDANGDGLIDFEEFCSLCTENNKSERGVEEEEERDLDLKEAFEVFDRDKDGLISVEELGLVLCSLGLKQGTRVEDCKEMIKKVDKDGDGMVNFDEFKKMMRNGANKNLISVF